MRIEVAMPRLSDAMKSLSGRSVDERPVRVADVERADDLSRCHALFVADATPRAAMPAWLRKAESLDVLTMGDGDGFAVSGGMIGLVSDGGVVAGKSSGTSPDRPCTRSRSKCPSVSSRGRPRSVASWSARLSNCAAITAACAGGAPSFSHSWVNCSCSFMAPPVEARSPHCRQSQVRAAAPVAG